MSDGPSPAGLVLAMLLAAGNDPPLPGSVQQLEVALPPEWPMGAQVVLMLEDVTTPRGIAFKVQVSARGESDADVLLGGFGVVADAAGASGSRAPASYRVDVTRGLRRWGERNPAAKTVTLALTTLDGRSRPIAVSWRVGRAFLKLRPDSPLALQRSRDVAKGETHALREGAIEAAAAHVEAVSRVEPVLDDELDAEPR